MICKKLCEDNLQNLKWVLGKKMFFMVCADKSEISKAKQTSLLPFCLYRFLHNLNINISIKKVIAHIS